MLLPVFAQAVAVRAQWKYSMEDQKRATGFRVYKIIDGADNELVFDNVQSYTRAMQWEIEDESQCHSYYLTAFIRDENGNIIEETLPSSVAMWCPGINNLTINNISSE